MNPTSSETLPQAPALPRAEQELLRHWLATLYYRADLALTDAPEAFIRFNAGGGSRDVHELVTHITHVISYLLRAFDPDGAERFFQEWSPSPSRAWRAELDAFTRICELTDRAISRTGLHCEWTVPQLIQGPMADAMTHVGQLALMRRLSGSPIQGQNYLRADIRAGVFPAIKG